MSRPVRQLAKLVLRQELMPLVEFVALSNGYVYRRTSVPTPQRLDASQYTSVISDKGRTLAFDGAQRAEVGATAGAYTNGLSFVFQARRSAASGVQQVAARGRGGIAGGVELALYNTFGAPAAGLYCYTNAGDFTAGFVNGQSATLSSGATATSTDVWYNVAGSIGPSIVPACSFNWSLGANEDTTQYFLTGNVSLLAVFAKELQASLLRSLSQNPWQIFAHRRRPVFAVPTEAAGGLPPFLHMPPMQPLGWGQGNWGWR
jgi:hypothetical protein